MIFPKLISFLYLKATFQTIWMSCSIDIIFWSIKAEMKYHIIKCIAHVFFVFLDKGYKFYYQDTFVTNFHILKMTFQSEPISDILLLSNLSIKLQSQIKILSLMLKLKSKLMTIFITCCN